MNELDSLFMEVINIRGKDKVSPNFKLSIKLNILDTYIPFDKKKAEMWTLVYHYRKYVSKIAIKTLKD